MSRERVVVATVVLALAIVAASIAWYGHVAVPGNGDAGSVVFNLTGVAGDGVWTLEEVNGLNYWWKRFQPATMHVREGDDVVINLRSADLFHCFYLPGFQVGPVDVEPGHMVTVRFTAERAGVYQYYCTSMCGTCHFYMRGWFVVTGAGEDPVQPPPIACKLCLPDAGPPPEGDDVVEVGAYLYRAKGCITCHGPEGHGGVHNRNSANDPVPAHDTTAQKLFIESRADAESFIRTVHREPDLRALREPPEIGRFPVVLARFENAKAIIREGRYSSKVDPSGPEPPLQMPAWQHLVSEREIDALLAYFISLYPWNDYDEDDVG